MLFIFLMCVFTFNEALTWADSVMSKGSTASASSSTMPLPFSRELYLTTPYLSGNDVIIAQNLLARDDSVDGRLSKDGVFGEQSELAVLDFQRGNNLSATGILDYSTAELLLTLHSADGYKDSDFTASSLGYKYKFHIPVHQNRSIETKATLYDGDNNVLMTFKARQHGHRDDGGSAPWPDFGDGGYGLNQFTSNGNTVTGLVEMDLNSPEPNPQLYGPWPVNRVVRGLEGNALFLLPNIRDGILVHTGNWTTADATWDSSKGMPNSAGCIHAHPEDVDRIYHTLVKLGVEVRDNTFSGKNYPYRPQGVGVIELVD